MMHSRSGTLMLLGDAYPTYRMFTQNYCLAFSFKLGNALPRNQTFNKFIARC